MPHLCRLRNLMQRGGPGQVGRDSHPTAACTPHNGSALRARVATMGTVRTVRRRPARIEHHRGRRHGPHTQNDSRDRCDRRHRTGGLPAPGRGRRDAVAGGPRCRQAAIAVRRAAGVQPCRAWLDLGGHDARCIGAAVCRNAERAPHDPGWRGADAATGPADGRCAAEQRQVARSAAEQLRRSAGAAEGGQSARCGPTWRRGGAARSSSTRASRRPRCWATTPRAT